MSIHSSLLRNNAFYLVESTDTGILALREITFEQYTSMVAICQELHEYHYQKRRLREVELNLVDFFTKYQYYESTALEKKYDDKQNFFELAYVDINRVLTNFLSSFRLYVDNLEIYLQKVYGDESNEYRNFKSVLKHEFDHKFEYRLLYVLRNYSQHMYFPINSIGLDEEFDKYSRQEKRIFSVSFDKDKFLERRDSFKHLLLDFTLFNRLFPVLPQLNKIKISINVIADAFLEIEKQKLITGMNKLLKSFKYREDNGELGFAQLKDYPQKPFFDSKEVPLPILRMISVDIEGREAEF